MFPFCSNEELKAATDVLDNLTEAFEQQLDIAFPKSRRRTTDSVRAEAKKRSSNIHNTYQTLHDIAARHEETTHKRWTKYSKNQRVRLLLECWPGMAAHHRPDYKTAQSQEPNRVREGNTFSGTDHPEHFMWPYINLEDLAKPRNLILLINARSRHHPSDFAAADIEAVKLGVKTRSILLSNCLPPHIMMLSGAKDKRSYGRITPALIDPHATHGLITGKEYNVGEGLVILQIQERLLEFLVGCCKAILHDIPADTLTTATFPVQPEPRLKTEIESNGFESLAVMAAEAPYRLPAKIDFGRIEGTLKAKAAALKDHIHALREDPEYFSTHINAVRSHRLELVKDTNGNAHPIFDAEWGHLFNARIIDEVVTRIYADLETFTELHRQARTLCDAYSQLSLQPSDDLPESFLMQILTFRFFLQVTFHGPLLQLWETFSASPNMSGIYVRDPPGQNWMKRQSMQQRTENFTKVQEQVHTLLEMLMESRYEEQRKVLGIPLLLDELERLIQAEPEAAKMLPSRVVEIISDMSIYGRCMDQLDRFQPWARQFENMMEPSDPELESICAVWSDQGASDPRARSQEIHERFRRWYGNVKEMMQRIEPNLFLEIGPLVDISGGRFRYPTAVRMTKEVFDARRKAEANLDAFWDAADKITFASLRSDHASIVRKLVGAQRTVQRTPERVDTEVLHKPLSTLYIGFTGAEGSAPSTPTAKLKEKTKGVATKEAFATTESEETVQDEKPKLVGVDTRSLKVFRTLFFNPGVTSSPGEIAWHDFVHAMTSTGLFAAEKLYGSAWQFERLATQSNTRILFHEPIPRARSHSLWLGGWEDV